MWMSSDSGRVFVCDDDDDDDLCLPFTTPWHKNANTCFSSQWLHLAWEHVQSFTLPVSAGWSREPFLSLIHSAVKTSAQSLHGNLTHTHTHFSLFCFTPGNKFQRQTTLLPYSLEEVCITVCVSDTHKCTRLTTNGK